MGSLPLVWYLTTHGEANEVSADTEASTLAGSHADGGGEDIQHSEHSGRTYSDSGYLIQGEALPGDEEESKSNSRTFNYIL